MDLPPLNGYILQNLDRINLVLGKNGCGKSSLLRSIDKCLFNKGTIGKVKYITPERGGNLIYDPGIDNTISQNPTWLMDTRRTNRFDQFRQQSMAQYRNLELLSLREIEKDKKLRLDLDHTFDTYVDKINMLLDSVEIIRAKSGFKIILQTNGTEISSDKISSGESELISLSIECLVFQKEVVPNKPNLLLLDEPDMHLHPDLQYRFGILLKSICSIENTYILIATHSTALLSALAEESYTRFEFMTLGQKKFNFKTIREAYNKILPIFGAHPLSNVFNEKPLLLVEGEDEERIWQQAVRTANAKLKLYPCSVGGKANLNEHEDEAVSIMKAVYEKAKAFSLRDGDGIDEDISDKPPLVRARLNCYSSENLLLTDEALAIIGSCWDSARVGIEKWMQDNTSHPHFDAMRSFAQSSFDRRLSNIKTIRNDILGILGCDKPWEVVVGKAIASIAESNNHTYSEGKMADFLGKKVVENFLVTE
ncbi:MAG: hypothetical protein SRB1_02334 [Desulfobacteraceae bacterium Eth-SRB1]|nr:MAG: hypothetical protein SRB1_02334 [Desulfobacteraceae bacterium Eth-SRB1]